jgi:hypothetical protein
MDCSNLECLTNLTNLLVTSKKITNHKPIENLRSLKNIYVAEVSDSPFTRNNILLSKEDNVALND